MYVLRRASRRRTGLLVVVAALVAGLLYSRETGTARAQVQLFKSSVKVSDGRLFTATNHLVSLPGLRLAADGTPAPVAAGNGRKYLLVWAGNKNIADTNGADIQSTQVGVKPLELLNQRLVDDPPGADFLAVIDAEPSSASYGKVVNTVTVGPLLENEPHHMQFTYHKGDKVYAGGLFSSASYVFDVSKLPVVTLSGATLPTDTLCGSIPDAFVTLSDHTAYGTWMGGPVLPGPCQYSDGSVRVGNGYGGTPGEVVHLSPDGKVLSQSPAASKGAEDPTRCQDLPVIPGFSSCASPHGIQAREDLHTLITSDYGEPKNVITDPVKPLTNRFFRSTVRFWDISDLNAPKVRAVSWVPDGPRKERNPGHEEYTGLMETAVTNRPEHRGDFVESMCGGAIYYTPDVTAPQPVFKQVFDNTAAAKVLRPTGLTEAAGCDGGGWLQVSPDDKYLFHTVIGRSQGSLGQNDPGSPKMVYVLDIEKLLASGNTPQCNIDDIKEVWDGGHEADCPALTSVLEVPDSTSGGPHFGAFDTFELQPNGHYKQVPKVLDIAITNYFISRSGVDGNHKVCIAKFDNDKGKLALDNDFRDENEGTPCVDFNRSDWPHGRAGDAKPHSSLFVVPDAGFDN